MIVLVGSEENPGRKEERLERKKVEGRRKDGQERCGKVKNVGEMLH